MKQIIVIVLILLSSHGQAQLLNTGFENWDSVSTHAYYPEMADSHSVSNPFNGVVSNWTEDSELGICQTTDGFEGNYAMIVQNWYSYIEGRIHQTVPINEYPTEISGMYRYRVVASGDVGLLGVIATDVFGDTTINEVFTFTGQEEWTAFTFSLPSVQSSESPGNMTVRFTSGTNNCDSPFMTCNLLYLDALQMGFGTTNTLENKAESAIKMYPNPAESSVDFSESIEGLVLRDLCGREVFRSENSSTHYSFQLPAGLYVATLQTDQGAIVRRLEVR
ncbi:T9SS type A sorting domain-containing protein [Crocinitomicaceae bacterium]|nr:T9SS type A sorting domain-containing protein [Crocinitomicaceae bacterium]